MVFIKDHATFTETTQPVADSCLPHHDSMTNFGAAAAQLLENGYEPIPIVPAAKRPAPSRWTSTRIDQTQVETWAKLYPDHGIGLRTGRLVAVDIDVLDPDQAHGLQALAFARFGTTLIRVGQWPKRLLLYQTDVPFPKMGLAKLDILAQGQQFVAFGLHPLTGHAYGWPLGETPLEVGLTDLPLVERGGLEAWLGEAQALFPSEESGSRKAATRNPSRESGSMPLRNAEGAVTDHRDGWLSSIAYHLVWDALDAGEILDPAQLAYRVWQRFVGTTDLSRGRGDGNLPYGPADALRKVGDKLRLLQSGDLPARDIPEAHPVIVDPGLPLDQARDQLDQALANACQQIEEWHVADSEGDAPRFGIRATVGLGKTAVSRRHLLKLLGRLRDKGLPHRIVVFTPSHVLAEESADDWRIGDLRVAVHRGFEARHPIHGEPMCRDLDMVRMATSSGQSVFSNACLRRGGSRCHAFDNCLKQDNLVEVSQADVVVAPYDCLYTGLGVSADKIAALVVDEACWPRAMTQIRLQLHVMNQMEAIDQPRLESPEQEAAAWEQLFALRKITAEALNANDTGVLARCHLVAAGLTVAACYTAIALERLLRADPHLRPGLAQGARKQAMLLSEDARRSIKREALFQAMAELLFGEAEQDGRIRILPPDPKTGAQDIVVTGLHSLRSELAAKPILHLDATLRPELAATVLPGLEVTEITASSPHMSLTLVEGRFAKTRLCEDPLASPDENQRRAKHLSSCADYVRWQARRVAPGRVLVVTYKVIEPAFAHIPGVEVAHFNAIAGLDLYKDVALLIVIGRPLPSEPDLHPMVGAYFREEPVGKYGFSLRAVAMRDGTRRRVKVIQHDYPEAEVLRAAICDDEVIQAIGRGRGVNRTADNPLEVQVLADVALPLVHDQVVRWELTCPDIFQRMLLAGIAVDSPADAAVLHPALFSTADQAKKAFGRAAFKGHSPIYNTYRGMSLKSARYRRGGRGHAWQIAWWLDLAPDDARRRLESVLEALDSWNPRE